jgi:hypothetical protein
MAHLSAPPLDLGIPLLGFAFLGASAVVLLVVVIVLEALIYRWMIPGGRSFRDSLLVNVASTILGVPFLWVAFPSDPNQGQLYAALAATWVLTVGIEAVFLRLVRRQTGWGRLIKVSVVANVVSYLLLAGIMIAIMVPPW